MKTILIAGATGTNGKEVVRRLSAAGQSVRAMVRDRAKASYLKLPNVELVEGDLSKPSTLDAAFNGVDRAFILTAIMPDTVQWFQNFFDAASRAGVRHVVKYSGMGASRNALSEVTRQHFESDESLRNSGLNYTIIQPNSFFQNLLGQSESIRKSGQFYLPLGDAEQSLIDVRDIAEVIERVLASDEHFGKTYELTGPEALTFYEVAQQVSEVAGKPVTYVPISVEAMESSLIEAGLPTWNAHALAEIMGSFSTGQYAYTTDTIENLLGRKPTSHAQWLSVVAEAFER
jgi:uncharacterized protein YbjT (DUF2867 family)